MLATKGMRQASAIHLATTARIDHGQRASWKRGFTLIEAVITLLVLGILSSLAVNSYNSYIERARAAEAIEQLDLFHKHMEKAFQDNGNYGAGACAVTPPTDVSTVTFATCLVKAARRFPLTPLARETWAVMCLASTNAVLGGPKLFPEPFPCRLIAGWSKRTSADEAA